MGDIGSDRQTSETPAKTNYVYQFGIGHRGQTTPKIRATVPKQTNTTTEILKAILFS